jgi:hypothetical protein
MPYGRLMASIRKWASACTLTLEEGVAAYQLVGEVTAHQGYDA